MSLLYFDSTSLKRAQKLYDDGKLVESDGAIGMDLSEEKLGFCILIKSDGNGLYSTKDIEVAHAKFEEFGIDRSLYVVDKRQEFHFKQVFKVLEKIGLPIPEDKLQMYQNAYDLLLDSGYIAIGMDHFARPNDEIALALDEHKLHRNFQGYSLHLCC